MVLFMDPLYFWRSMEKMEIFSKGGPKEEFEEEEKKGPETPPSPHFC